MAKGLPIQRQPIYVDHLKPQRFKDYLTLGELAIKVNRDKSWIIQLERQGRLPEAKRHKIGELSIRLYSPAQVAEIERILSTLRPGRPRKS